MPEPSAADRSTPVAPIATPQTEGEKGAAKSVIPDRIAVDANGYGWRVWNDWEFWSMVPTNPDNSPIPEPVTWFVPEDESAGAVLGEVVDWLGVPDWTGPQMPEELARRIARVLEHSSTPEAQS